MHIDDRGVDGSDRISMSSGPDTRFQDMIELSWDWFWETGPDHRFTYVSEQIVTVCGIQPQDVLDKTRLEFAQTFGLPEDEEKWRTHLDDLDHHRPFRDFSYRAKAGNGKVLYVRISGKPFYGENGEFLGYRGCGTDDREQVKMQEALKEATEHLERRVTERTRDLQDEIAERRRVESALRESEETLRSVLELSTAAITFKDTEGRFQLVNRRCEEFYGPREEILGRTIYEILGNTDGAEQYTRMDRQVFETRLPCEYETEVHWPDGRPPTNFLTIKFPIFDGDDELIGLCCFDIDNTERKAAEEEMRRLRNLLANIVNSMPSVLVGVDRDGCITEWNYKAISETGVPAEAALGRPFQEVLPWLSGELKNIREAISNAKPVAQSKVATRVGEETRYDDITIYPLVTNGIEGAVIRIDDVTERVRIEEMMIQTEKMLSIGGLTAGMAHEINNPLAGMLQNAQLARNRLRIDTPKSQAVAEECGLEPSVLQQYVAARGIDNMLETIINSGKRAARIVDNMLTFSRKSRFESTPQDLGALLDNTLELLASDYNLKAHYDFRSVEIHRDYAEDVPLVPCDPNQLQQVFLNVLRNAAHAMHSAKDRPSRLELRIYRENNNVLTEVEDNGIGIPEEALHRLFEPFFTTKDVGDGTGLGLSVSYFIVTQNHGGEIDVASTPGESTRFIIKLPLSERHT